MTTPAPAAAKAPKTPKAAKAAAPATTEAAPAVAETKPAKAPKAPKAAKAAATEAAPVVAAEPAAPAATEASVASADFAGFATKLQQVSALLSTLRAEFRALEKSASRELKTANKASSKKKRKAGNRSPSGFVKPTLITPELAAFLGKPAGTEMARTEVTREINAYIRAHGLQDKTNGRKINADAKLGALLKLKTDEERTYFNLQRYRGPHFVKAEAATA
jgi:chromatin remodeling complex protein RSC6